MWKTVGDWVMGPNFRWYATLGLMSLLILVGVPWALKVWKEAKGNIEGPTDTPDRLLGPLEEAFASGQMSEEEYLKIRSSVEKVAPIKGRLLPSRPPAPRPIPPLEDVDD